MKIKRLFVFVYTFIILVTTSFCSMEMKAQTVPDSIKIRDSLYVVLENCNIESEKIRILRMLVNQYWRQPEEVVYLKQIIDIANNTNSMEMVYGAMSELSRHYYQLGSDSLMYWRGQLDSLSSARQEYPDALFKVGNLICRKYLSEANYELAMNEALLQLARAEKVGHAFGLMSSKQNLGLIYQAVRRDSEAVKVFREGLQWDKDKGVERGFVMQYLSDMVVSSLRINDFEESETLLKRYQQIYEDEQQRYKAMGITYPKRWHSGLINSYYTELYVGLGQLDKAKKALEQAAQFAESETDASVKYFYYRARALYYQRIKNSVEALKAIDNALVLKEDLEMLKRKVDVLRSDGQTQKALVVYEDLLKSNAEISNEAFNRQIKQLRILNDLNDKHEQDSALEYQNEQIQIRQRLLFISVLFVVVLLSVLYFLVRYYRRTCRLKDELLSEKDSLVASERLLKIAKDEAEKANRQKTAFIANISHEVRTPLNAIVGFSELLAENTFSEKSRIEFASTINDNSEILMNLVNDVLDLSRLESANSRFTFTLCEIVSCCEDIIASVEDKVADNVRLTFTSSVNSFELKTEANRIRQLLNKLLLNACKFTTEGEINLSIEIDEEEQMVCFAVTDTGCGIPLEKQSLVFERFEKLDDFAQGTGLGLPICRLIATKLGGKLFVDSNYTKGARFVFLHPIIKNS